MGNFFKRNKQNVPPTSPPENRETETDSSLPVTLSPIKVILLGDSTVGKTSFFIRVTQNRFDANPMVSSDEQEITHTFNKKVYKLSISDTEGKETFRTIDSQYFKEADAVIFMYDVIQEKTLENIDRWADEVQLYSADETVKVLVGNKIDLKDKKFTDIKGESKASEKKMQEFFLASVKENVRIKDILDFICDKVQKNED
eukprot:TRINITY_DN7486_c0_g6_i1.p1 TRINITY_DN7486_c0_g6~~TRINITY_DN7486_c0_g6_i1.p1  ORF type:complete len:200 (+),score=48.43 TRINITY_DN7486_c0_g6_i1:70-669(+)